jgi:NAD(P)H dehydrogenase (quinone)
LPVRDRVVGQRTDLPHTQPFGRAHIVCRSFVDAAVRAGVRHVVYTPIAGAAADATSTLARELSGREIRYQEESVAEAHVSRQMFTAVRWKLEAWITAYTAIAAGELAAVTKDVERIIGRPATPFEQLLRDAQR